MGTDSDRGQGVRTRWHVEGQEILIKRARKSGGRSAGVEQDTVIAAGPRACILTWRAERGNCSLPCIHHPLRPLFALHISGGLSGGGRSDAASPILESRLESKNIALPVTERGLDGGLGGPGRGRTPTSLVSVSWQLMDTRCTYPSRKKARPRIVPAMTCGFKAQQPPTSPLAQNPEDMHRPPPPLPSCMYGTLPCHMPCACLLPSCAGPVKRTGGVSGTPSGVVRLRTVLCIHSPRLPHTSRRRHRAASGMVRRCSCQSLRGVLTPSVTAWIADTPGKGRGKSEVSLFVAVPHRRVECRIEAAVKEEDTQGERFRHRGDMTATRHCGPCKTRHATPHHATHTQTRAG